MAELNEEDLRVLAVRLKLRGLQDDVAGALAQARLDILTDYLTCADDRWQAPILQIAAVGWRAWLDADQG